MMEESKPMFSWLGGGGWEGGVKLEVGEFGECLLAIPDRIRTSAMKTRA
jgi:hypothetical protein